MFFTTEPGEFSASKQMHSMIWQGLDGEATEPMIKELEEDREECQDPEVEFAIAGAVKDCGGLEIILSMIQVCPLCSVSIF